MAEAYPWGSLAPEKRVSQLKAALVKSEEARERIIEQHRSRLAEMDDAIRATRADIATAERILDRETREEQSLQLTKLLARSNVDLGALLANPDGLQAELARLAAEAAQTATAAERTKEPRGTRKSAEPKPAAGSPNVPDSALAEGTSGAEESVGGDGASESNTGDDGK